MISIGVVLNNTAGLDAAVADISTNKNTNLHLIFSCPVDDGSQQVDKVKLLIEFINKLVENELALCIEKIDMIGLSLDALPEDIGKLVHLKELDLSYNKLSSLLIN